MLDRGQIIGAAEDGDLPRLLSLVSLDEIVDAWWRYKARAGGDSSGWDTDPDGWAMEIHFTFVFYGDEDAFRDYLRALVRRAPDDREALGHLAAGPIEDFVSADEGRLGWIEQEAAHSETFRLALSNVWAEHIGPRAFLRLQAAAGTELVWHVNHGPRPMPDGSFADPNHHRSMT